MCPGSKRINARPERARTVYRDRSRGHLPNRKIRCRRSDVGEAAFPKSLLQECNLPIALQGSGLAGSVDLVENAQVRRNVVSETLIVGGDERGAPSRGAPSA
jgi:hypothetical protein